MLSKRANWSRPLPRPIIIPKVATLTTLADARALIEQHLPADYRQRWVWRYAAAELERAAEGGDAAEASLVLRMVFSMQGIRCQPR